MGKIKIAFVHKPGHPYLSGEYFSPQSYRFYIKGLMNNDRVSVYPINTTAQIDDADFKTFDIILFVGMKRGRDNDKNIYRKFQVIKKPKVACCYDCQKFNTDVLPMARTARVTNFFYHHNKAWFYRFVPREYNYRQIFMCLDDSLVKKVLDWKYRQREKILVTGALNDIKYYQLRKLCAELPYTHYVGLKEQFSGDRFNFLLQGFTATVSACDVVTVNKYIEGMSCATLTFAQANNINHWENLGLVDGENCMLINEKNYEEKMQEYLKDKDNPKWEAIAYKGREHVLKNFNLNSQVNKFVDYVEELI